MTRLEAIKTIRSGQPVKKMYWPEPDGVSSGLEVAILYQKYCDYSRERQYQHASIGPIHVRFWAGHTPHWIHLSPKQLLGWIKRSFQRH